MDDFKDALREHAPAIGGVLILMFCLSNFFWFQASQEAAAFNRFTTGPKATTWDALWVELRVEADRCVEADR